MFCVVSRLKSKDLFLDIRILLFINTSSSSSYHLLFSSFSKFVSGALYCHYTLSYLKMCAWWIQSSFLLWIHQQLIYVSLIHIYWKILVFSEFMMKNGRIFEHFWGFCLFLWDLSCSIAAICHGSHLALLFFPSFLNGEYNMTNPQRTEETTELFIPSGKASNLWRDWKKAGLGDFRKCKPFSFLGCAGLSQDISPKENVLL